MNSNVSPFSPFSKSWCCAGYWGVELLLSAFRNSRRCYFGFGINSFHLTLSKWNQQFPSLVPKLVSLKLFFPLLTLSLVPLPSSHDLGMLRKAGYGLFFFFITVAKIGYKTPCLQSSPNFVSFRTLGSTWHYMASLFVTLFKTTGRGQEWLTPYS